MVLFGNGNPYCRHLQNDMPIYESLIKCIDFTNNSKIGFSIARQQHQDEFCLNFSIYQLPNTSIISKSLSYLLLWLLFIFLTQKDIRRKLLMFLA